MSKALYARLLCHELLPLDVERAIAMDLGDILVFEDILGLWESSSNMFKKVCLPVHNYGFAVRLMFSLLLQRTCIISESRRGIF